MSKMPSTICAFPPCSESIKESETASEVASASEKAPYLAIKTPPFAVSIARREREGKEKRRVLRLSQSIKTNTKGVSGTDTGQLLQVIAIAIGSLALGMRIGRLLTLWEEKTKNRDYESDEGRY